MKAVATHHCPGELRRLLGPGKPTQQFRTMKLEVKTAYVFLLNIQPPKVKRVTVIAWGNKKFHPGVWNEYSSYWRGHPGCESSCKNNCITFGLPTILFNKNLRGSCGKQSSRHFRAFSSTSMYFAHGTITFNEALDSTKTGLREQTNALPRPFAAKHQQMVCKFAYFSLLPRSMVFLPKPPPLVTFCSKKRSLQFFGLDKKLANWPSIWLSRVTAFLLDLTAGWLLTPWSANLRWFRVRFAGDASCSCKTRSGF